MQTAEQARLTHFPYCLLLQADGGYVITNRRYKPVGMTTTDWVDYEAVSASIHFVGMTASRAAQLDCEGRSNLERIYLYNDGCIPTVSGPHWESYSKKLRVLAGMQVGVAGGG